MKNKSNQYILVNADFSTSGTFAILHGIILSIILKKNLYLSNTCNKNIEKNNYRLRTISQNIINEYNIGVTYNVVRGKTDKLNEIIPIATGLNTDIDPLLIITGINNNIKHRFSH